MSKTLDLEYLRTEVDRVMSLVNVNGIQGLYISTPFSKGYHRIEASQPDDFNRTIIQAILYLLRERNRDGSIDRVTIEDKDGIALFAVSLFGSVVEIKDQRTDDSTQKFKIIPKPSK